MMSNEKRDSLFIKTQMVSVISHVDFDTLICPKTYFELNINMNICITTNKQLKYYFRDYFVNCMIRTSFIAEVI